MSLRPTERVLVEAGASARCVGDSSLHPRPSSPGRNGAAAEGHNPKELCEQALPGPQLHLYERKIGGQDDCLRSFLLQQVLVDEHIMYGPNWDTLEC